MKDTEGKKTSNKNIVWPDYADAVLILEDGSIFFGNGIGVEGTTSGEACFNTSMTGYQEIITDPSYCGQIIVFTFPHIGNVGTNALDCEADNNFSHGVIVGEVPTLSSNWRSSYSLHNWLEQKSSTGIANIDTRALTKHIREHGVQNALIYFNKENKVPLDTLFDELAKTPNMNGQDLAKVVSCKTPYTWHEERMDITSNTYKNSTALDTSPHIVVVDFGVKKNILREISHLGCRITVVPCTYSADKILSLQPDGVFLSNGPGDPMATSIYVVPVVKELLNSGIPIFGICLGHQILAIALGAKTEKMQFGHRGGNHPVKNLKTTKVEITSQNHGFCVLTSTLPDTVEETHVSLFDGTNEGLEILDKNVFSVQYHPEASPGPQDSTYLFQQFWEHILCYKTQKAAA